MTFQDWKSYAQKFEKSYVPHSRDDQNLSREDKLEIDFWDMVEYQLHDEVKI